MPVGVSCMRRRLTLRMRVKMVFIVMAVAVFVGGCLVLMMVNVLLAG